LFFFLFRLFYSINEFAILAIQGVNENDVPLLMEVSPDSFQHQCTELLTIFLKGILSNLSKIFFFLQGEPKVLNFDSEQNCQPLLGLRNVAIKLVLQVRVR
jgi:hypothetical protein